MPCEATSAPSYRRTSPAFPSLGDIQISCLLPQTSEHRQRHHSDRLRVVQPVRLSGRVTDSWGAAGEPVRGAVEDDQPDGAAAAPAR